MKRPSFQFYPGDWMRDTSLRSCSIAARGLWIDMICLMHEGYPYGTLKVNLKVILPPTLARMVGCTLDELLPLLTELETAGVFSRDDAGCIYSRRMMQDETVRQARAEGGRMGGNPSLKKKVKPKVNLKVEDKVNQNPTSEKIEGYPDPEDEDDHDLDLDQDLDPDHSPVTVPMPPGFPESLKHAQGLCSTSCPEAHPDYVRDVWETLRDVGGRDGSNRQVLNFASYVKRRWRNEEMEWSAKRRNTASRQSPRFDPTPAEPEISWAEVHQQNIAKRLAAEKAERAEISAAVGYDIDAPR